MPMLLSAILTVILDFFNNLFLAKLQEIFNLNLKYRVLNSAVMCTDDFSVMVSVTNKFKR